MTEPPEHDWLPEARPAPRRGVLEDTLFRRLEDLRRKPPGDLVDLVERTLDVLRATKEALLEQRQEIRALATTVETLRSRVDRIARQSPAPAQPAVMPPPAHGPAGDPEPAAPDHDSAGHLLLLGLDTGYRLFAAAGPPPAPGERIVHEGARFEVVNGKASPLPGETRRVVFALPSTAADPGDDG